MEAWPMWFPCHQVSLALTRTALRLAWLRQRGMKKEQMSVQWSWAWVGCALQWKCTSSLEVPLLLKMLLTESLKYIFWGSLVYICCWSCISMWRKSSLTSWASSTTMDLKLSLSLCKVADFTWLLYYIPMLSTRLVTITKHFLYTPWSF